MSPVNRRHHSGERSNRLNTEHSFLSLFYNFSVRLQKAKVSRSALAAGGDPSHKMTIIDIT